MRVRKFSENDVEEILSIYQTAFSGYPWFEDLSMNVVKSRWNNNCKMPGFTCLVYENEKSVVGAVWWDYPNYEALKLERGEILYEFSRKFSSSMLVWEREVMISPAFQGKGCATFLRKKFLEEIKESSLVLTRMRDDNYGIIKIAEKLGFSRTGIRMPSTQKEGVSHEYWYLKIR